jgi:hypothetical protein
MEIKKSAAKMTMTWEGKRMKNTTQTFHWDWGKPKLKSNKYKKKAMKRVRVGVGKRSTFLVKIKWI